MVNEILMCVIYLLFNGANPEGVISIESNFFSPRPIISLTLDRLKTRESNSITYNLCNSVFKITLILLILSVLILILERHTKKD